MIWGQRPARALKQVSLLLAMLAVALKVLIPAGYLLSAQAGPGGMPTMVVCTGQGEFVVAVDADGKPIQPGQSKPGDSKSKGGDHPCTFAAASAGHVAPAPFAILEPVRFVWLSSPPRLTTQRPGLGLAAPPPYTTGPPSII